MSQVSVPYVQDHTHYTCAIHGWAAVGLRCQECVREQWERSQQVLVAQQQNCPTCGRPPALSGLGLR